MKNIRTGARIVLYVFLLLIIPIEFGSLITGTDYHLYTKPLIIPSLALFYYLSTRSTYGRWNFLLYLALLFSWAGDVLLMFDEGAPIFFMLGLATFLMAHIFYIVLFRKSSGNKLSTKKKRSKVTGTLMLIIYTAFFVTIMYPHLNNLRAPVLVYSTVIVMMAISALWRTGSGSKQILVGAILFVLSDSLLAYNKFVSPIPYERLLVMLTYILAQLNIVQGMISASERANPPNGIHP